jgi:hypothetical protein
LHNPADSILRLQSAEVKVKMERVVKRLYLAGIAALAAVTGCGGGSSIGGLDAEASYQFALTAAAEVPTPKPTTAIGTATIILYPNSVDYELSGGSLIGATMAHIHSGAIGATGPIIVTLYQPASPSGTINGTFASGSLTAANLPAGLTVAALKTLILSGNAYINVHTTANPSGELRGQIK